MHERDQDKELLHCAVFFAPGAAERKRAEETVLGQGDKECLEALKGPHDLPMGYPLSDNRRGFRDYEYEFAKKIKRLLHKELNDRNATPNSVFTNFAFSIRLLLYADYFFSPPSPDFFSFFSLVDDWRRKAVSLREIPRQTAEECHKWLLLCLARLSFRKLLPESKEILKTSLEEIERITGKKESITKEALEFLATAIENDLHLTTFTNDVTGKENQEFIFLTPDYLQQMVDCLLLALKIPKIREIDPNLDQMGNSILAAAQIVAQYKKISDRLRSECVERFGEDGRGTDMILDSLSKIRLSKTMIMSKKEQPLPSHSPSLVEILDKIVSVLEGRDEKALSASPKTLTKKLPEILPKKLPENLLPLTKNPLCLDGQIFPIIETLPGGMSQIIIAEDPRIPDRKIALKILSPEQGNKNVETAKLLIELRKNAPEEIRSRIQEIYGILCDESGNQYLSMEYIEGKTLEALANNYGGALPTRPAIIVVKKITEALAHIHSKNMVHGDLKPSNIMVVGKDETTESGETAARVVIIDWDTSRRVGPAGEYGTPAYVAPEQVSEKKLYPKSDIYSLGIIIYEALTGENPMGPNYGGTFEERFPKTGSLPEPWLTIIKGCTQVDFRNRLLAIGVLDLLGKYNL